MHTPETQLNLVIEAVDARPDCSSEPFARTTRRVCSVEGLGRDPLALSIAFDAFANAINAESLVHMLRQLGAKLASRDSRSLPAMGVS